MAIIIDPGAMSDRSDSDRAVELLPNGHDMADGGPLTALERAHETMRQRRALGIKPVKLDPREKAKRRPTSLRLAVTAKCWDCVNGAVDPLPRARIRDCPCPTCPLHPVRPFQNVKSGKPGAPEELEDDGDEVELDLESEA